MKLLRNLSITAKSLISTMIGLLVVIGVALLAIISFSAFQSANDLKGLSTGLINDARDGWTDLARAQSSLYRAINLKSRNVEVGLVRKAKVEATQSIKRSQYRLASLKLGSLPVEHQLVSDAAK